MSRIPFEMDQEDVDRDLEALGFRSPPTPEEQDALDLEEGVTEALLNAEDIARRCRETELADCLARLQVIWAIGGAASLLVLLDRARDACLEALREVTDEIQP
jgi:hypothetical protein